VDPTRTAVAERTIAAESTPNQLWPHLTQTDKTNRLIGAPAITFEALSRSDSAARYQAKAKVFGLELRYRELPFEWEENRHFLVQREMEGGPIRAYRYSLDLKPIASGTTVKLRMEVEGHRLMPLPLVRAFADKFMRDNARVVGQIDAHLKRQAPNPFALPVSPVRSDLLQKATERLQQSTLPQDLVQRLRDLIQNGPDAEVLRIRPYEVADRWSMPKADVLRGFLLGVQAGFFELRWALVCPSCTVSADSYKDFSEIVPPGHCQLCDIRFDIELDRAVEAVFQPHPAIRAVNPLPFCIGGPGRTPHVRAQRILSANQTASLRGPDEPGHYRLFARGGATATLNIEEGAATESKFVYANDAWQPAVQTMAPGGTLQLENATSTESHAKVEFLGYATLAATAQEVSSLPEFTRAYSRALLKPRTPMKVSHVTLLFTDLVGSTALYNDVGDAEAFRFVDDHFDVLRSAIEACHGSVVKTMGDAVMASYLDVPSALRSSAQMLAQFNAFVLKHDQRFRSVGLKIGLYSGPCYVVTANDAPDYFGQTANVAARLQGLAGSGEVVLTRADYDTSGDQEQTFRVVDESRLRVKGVAHELTVVKVAPKQS
jgi:adenylate cyclase